MMDQEQYESRHGLRVPILGRQRPELDLRPRRVQEWLRQLPLADPQESCRRLLALVQTSNRAAVDATTRYRFADAIHETVGFGTRALIKGISHRGFPLTVKALQQADLCNSLLRSFADTYKLIVVDAIAGGRSERKLLAASLQHALQQLGRLLLDHYVLYAPPSDGLWLDLHRLHRIAEDHELLTPAAASRRAPIGSRIGELYRQSLLVSLANPYRLRRDELGRVLTLASALAHKLIVSPQPTQHTTFQIRTEQDRPPYPRAQEHDVGNVRYVDLSAVVEALDEAGLEHNEPELQLRRRLLALWRRPPRRGFKRITQASDIRVGLGLDTAHFLLEREAPAVPEIPAEIPPALGVVPPLDLPTNQGETHIALDHSWYDDGNERFFPTASRRSESVPHYPLPGMALPEREYRDSLWRTVDVSARGCCLLWDSDKPSSAKVGEVVSLREHSSPSWTVGVVRWMQYEPDQGLKLGIEILAPSAEAVLARNTRDRRQDSALELPAIRAAGLPASLIVASTQHHVGEQLEVLHQGMPRRVRLTEELERNGSFSHFVYDRLDGDRPGATSERESQ